MFYQGAVFSTWRQCGGNIVVLLGGIFSLAYTGLSGLYYPQNPTIKTLSSLLYLCVLDFNKLHILRFT